MNPIAFYQAAGLTDEEIKNQFVVRKNEFDRIMADIRRDNPRSSVQHYVLVGQRGSGKSTLLRRIQAEIETDAELSTRLVAINLSEEQAGIYRLHDLWDRVAQELREKNIPVADTNWEAFGNDLTAYSRAIYADIQKAIKKAGKRIVLLLDNIDRILENIKEKDSHLFRELLTNFKDVRIVGGSTRLGEHYWSYAKPFYEFFSIQYLQPLTQQELVELLDFWSDYLKEPKLKTFVTNNPGKLNAVRMLSDGMPRTMLNLVELLINRPEERGYDYLRYIVDRATPVYQERLGTLSPLHQKIVLELSFFWDAAKIKALAQSAHIEGKVLSAALNQLVELGIVEKIKGKGKNFFYRLKERFFNFWLIMTQGGPKQKSQAKWLTVFLECWYDDNEIKSIYSSFISDVTDGKLNAEKAVVMAKAFVHSKSLSVDERDNLIDIIRKALEGNKEMLALFPSSSGEIYSKIYAHLKNKKITQAQSLLNTLEQTDDTKWLTQACIEGVAGREINVLKYLSKIKRLDLKISTFVLARIYNRIDISTMAEKYFLLSIKHGHMNANLSLGLLYLKEDHFGKAEKYLLNASQNGLEDAFHPLAVLYRETDQTAKAEKYFLLAIKNDNDDAKLDYAMLQYSHNKNKKEVFALINKPIDNSTYPEYYIQAVKQAISLWAGHPVPQSMLTMTLKSAIKEPVHAFLSFFISSNLFHHQKQTIWQWFHDPEIGEQLKQMFRPYYYATAHLINNEASKEILLAQPDELQEAVNDVLKTIAKGQEFYYGKKANT